MCDLSTVFWREHFNPGIRAALRSELVRSLSTRAASNGIRDRSGWPARVSVFGAAKLMRPLRHLLCQRGRVGVEPLGPREAGVRPARGLHPSRARALGARRGAGGGEGVVGRSPPWRGVALSGLPRESAFHLPLHLSLHIWSLCEHSLQIRHFASARRSTVLQWLYIVSASWRRISMISSGLHSRRLACGRARKASFVAR